MQTLYWKSAARSTVVPTQRRSLCHAPADNFPRLHFICSEHFKPSTTNMQELSVETQNQWQLASTEQCSKLRAWVLLGTEEVCSSQWRKKYGHSKYKNILYFNEKLWSWFEAQCAFHELARSANTETTVSSRKSNSDYHLLGAAAIYQTNAFPHHLQ